MNKQHVMQVAVVGALALMLQACAIPQLLTKKAETKLPEQFNQQAAMTENTANMNWKTFFDDPHLQGLIDTAVANNKEVNILIQRISIAANEIQARKGEYMPFVTIGAGAEVEKAARYTRNGAVEEQLEIKEGKKFPDPLGNYQFGLQSSWELDVWKKLRNATKVATMEYMASVEGQKLFGD